MQKNLQLISALLTAQQELIDAGGLVKFGGGDVDAAREKFLAARQAVAERMKETDSIYASLTDEEARAAGTEIASDFGLKRSREHGDRYETENGTFTVIGIARRALHIIESARESVRKK